MSRRALIAATGSVVLHAGLLLVLARAEPPRARPPIGRPADGAIAVELLAAGGGTAREAPAGGSAPEPSHTGGGRRSGALVERPSRPSAALRIDVEPSDGGDAAPDGRTPSVANDGAAVAVGADAEETMVPGGADGYGGADGGSKSGVPEIGAGEGNGAGSGAGMDGSGVAGIGADGAGSGASTAGGPASGAADWAMLEAHLRTHAPRCYPPAARRRAIQGGAELHFCVGEDGMPGSIRLEKSSGSSLLDRAAIDCVLRGAAPLPGPRGCVTVPVWFRL